MREIKALIRLRLVSDLVTMHKEFMRLLLVPMRDIGCKARKRLRLGTPQDKRIRVKRRLQLVPVLVLANKNLEPLRLVQVPVLVHKAQMQLP